jgi:hypothetical protein
MKVVKAAGAYRTATTRTGTLVMEPEERAADCPSFLWSQCVGDSLPQRIHDPQVENLGERGAWRVLCREGRFDLRARGLEVHQGLPGFFDPMLATHALPSGDRSVVRWLLRLLRLPGGAKLLRAWHARRGR